MAEDDQYREAFIAYLDRGRPDDLAVLFRHPALRRRTQKAIAKVLRYADRHGDRHGAPEKDRAAWRHRREQAKAERAVLLSLADTEAGPPSLRRLAFQRLAEEYADDWRTLVDTRPSPVSMRALVQLTPGHARRFLQLLREERERA
jgi:hypothetical protein